MSAISGRVAASVAAVYLLAAPLPSAAQEVEVDLIGTWFVLIHYRDSMTANPDSDRWEDKVWKIQKKGSRLQWTEYPIVVFNDGSGRFGRVGRNPRARLLHSWEPNEAQMAEIQQGIQVNSRGSKTKSLRGSPKRGYKSSSASRSTSALTVGYVETWTIDDPTGVPVFTRDDALGTESALATKSSAVVSGRTRYETLEVLDGGNVLQGTYTRDENKKGSFRLIRGGAVRGIGSDGRTPNQKAQERAREQIRSGMQDAAYSEFLKTLGNDTVRDLRDMIGEDGISAVWNKYSKRIIAGDERARQELSDDLRNAYATAAEKRFAEAIANGNAGAFFEGQKHADPKRAALLKRVHETLGDEKIARLREKYGERVRAGDEKAVEALKEEVRKAFEDAMRQQFKEMQRGERGRR